MASNLPAFPIENYQHEKILGKGGYGTVSLYKKKKSLMRYFESSSSQPKKVAVKIFLSNDAKEIEKFNKLILVKDNEITELNMDLSSLNDFRNGMEAKN